MLYSNNGCKLPKFIEVFMLVVFRLKEINIVYTNSIIRSIKINSFEIKVNKME